MSSCPLVLEIRALHASATTARARHIDRPTPARPHRAETAPRPQEDARRASGDRPDPRRAERGRAREADKASSSAREPAPDACRRDAAGARASREAATEGWLQAKRLAFKAGKRGEGLGAKASGPSFFRLSLDASRRVFEILFQSRAAARGPNPCRPLGPELGTGSTVGLLVLLQRWPARRFAIGVSTTYALRSTPSHHALPRVRGAVDGAPR